MRSNPLLRTLFATLLVAASAVAASAQSTQVNGKVLQGLSAADTILDETKAYDADLIVLGSHGRRG